MYVQMMLPQHLRAGVEQKIPRFICFFIILGFFLGPYQKWGGSCSSLWRLNNKSLIKERFSLPSFSPCSLFSSLLYFYLLLHCILIMTIRAAGAFTGITSMFHVLILALCAPTSRVKGTDLKSYRLYARVMNSTALLQSCGKEPVFAFFFLIPSVVTLRLPSNAINMGYYKIWNIK